MMSLWSTLKRQERNWLDLPTDVTTNILNRIGMVEILENAQKVCTAWRKICKDPVLWRVINMNDLLRLTNPSTAKIICKHAVDRSQGQLVDLTLINDYHAELFLYAADRSSQLKRLEVASSPYFRFGSLPTDALMKFPLLEELNLYLIDISEEEIETLGRYCPMLKTLKVNEKAWCLQMINIDEKRLNMIAKAIGQNLVELRHLELIGTTLTNTGLQVILENCLHLETLDLRGCLNINLNADLRKKCSQLIKHLKLPKDSLKGCPYFDKLVNKSLEDEEEVPYVDTYYDVYDYDPFDD